jgi:1,4-dihydroxy-6-naphthoate synthase
MKLSLAISTCPNDTFAFEALINKRIDFEGINFDLHFADIDELNKLAQSAMADVIKLSYATYPSVSKHYQMLTAGSALGNGVGPLVISKRKIYPDELPFTKIAIPGDQTTANLLFTIFFPNCNQKKVYLFSNIEEAILSNEVDAGVIIHENRFTYQKKGLFRIVDLGEMWEKATQLPIPLGGIAVKRDLSQEIKQQISKLIRQSVEFGLANPTSSNEFVCKYAQEMDLETQRQHIDLYVNHYTIDIGAVGRRAISTLWDKAAAANLCPPPFLPTFVG